MLKSVLCNRSYNTADNDNLRDSWYACLDLFRLFPSVVDVHLLDTTSSSGDWQGYIMQKIGNRWHIILFEQENNYPHKGFTVRTDNKPVISSSYPMNRDEIIGYIEFMQEGV